MPSCIERARALRPQVVVYPNNRRAMPGIEEFGTLVQQLGAPVLAYNRTGKSWVHACHDDSVAYSGSGDVLAMANRDGRKESLICDIDL